jgi:hypothetical protein
MPKNEQSGVEQRSLTTTIAIAATPVAVVVAPVVGAWADQHFSHGENPTDSPRLPQQQQPKDD